MRIRYVFYNTGDGNSYGTMNGERTSGTNMREAMHQFRVILQFLPAVLLRFIPWCPKRKYFALRRTAFYLAFDLLGFCSVMT